MIRDFPKWWAFLTYDGFKSHVKVTEGLEIFAEERINNLVTKYGFPKGSYVIPNKAAYMDDETWAKVVKVVAPGIRKNGGDQCCFCLL